MKACNSACVHPHHTVLWELLLPWRLRLQSSFLPASWLHTCTHARFQNTLFWGMRGFFGGLTLPEYSAKSFVLAGGGERIAMMLFLLVKKTPTSAYFTKQEIKLPWVSQCVSSQMSSSPVILLFPKSIVFTFFTAKLFVLSLLSTKTVLPFPRKSLLLTFASVF